MFQSPEGALGADKRRDGSRSRSRFHDDKIEFPIKRQSGAAGFAPKALLDRTRNVSFESPPKRGNLVELARASGSCIPVPIFLLIGVYAERILGQASRPDRLMENGRIVSAMHVTR
jgi:hypothetical protein